MMSINMFKPNLYISKFNVLTSDMLKKNHCHVLLCDIDNTLIPHDQKEASQEAITFLNQLHNDKITIVLISNNNEKRVSHFMKDLAHVYYPSAKKPLKYTYKKIMNDLQCNQNEVAIMGDQLLTDILGGNRMGFYTILTKPLVERDLKITKFNRILENWIYKRFAKKNILVKGEFDDKKM